MIKLRDLNQQDDNLLVAYLNNKKVVQYLSSRIPQPYTLEDAAWWINTGCKDQATVKAITFNNVFCGVIGVYHQPFEYAHSAEIGYWLAEEFWNKGITSKALQIFSQSLFDNTDIVRLYAPVFSGNTASMRVLEKAGFSFEGISAKALFKHGKYYDEHRFARVY